MARKSKCNTLIDRMMRVVLKGIHYSTTSHYFLFQQSARITVASLDQNRNMDFSQFLNWQHDKS